MPFHGSKSGSGRKGNRMSDRYYPCTCEEGYTCGECQLDKTIAELRTENTRLRERNEKLEAALRRISVMDQSLTCNERIDIAKAALDGNGEVR